MSFKKVFTDIRHFQIFFLGAFSGMPLMILYTTLFAWLKDANIETKIITTFAIARVFYSLKFIWAPLVDHIKIPLLSRIGLRKSWMVLCCICISFILYCYSFVDPNESITKVYYITIVLGLASATFDIAFDAFRIEKLEQDMQAMGAANAIFGYRMGCLVSGAGALFWADNYGWSSTFMGIAALYLLCVVFILFISEADLIRENISGLNMKSWKILIFNPFADFFKREYSIIILLAVIFYKLGDAMLGVVAIPFYMELGFSKTEIAHVSKIYGLIATIVGSYLGGWLLLDKGNIQSLIIAGIAQSVTNIAFIWLNHQGHDVMAFTIAITIENVAAGVGTAVLVGYLSNLCNKQYSATQYALLSSASGLFSHSIVMYGGLIQDKIGWDLYFAMTVVLAIPGLFLLYFLHQRMNRDAI